MAKSPADSLASFLVAQGEGTFNVAGPWRVAVGREPDEPNRVVSLFDSGGLPDNPKFRINYPSVQVRVRGRPDIYDEAWSKMNDIKELLVGLDAQDIEGDRWSGIIMIGNVAFLQYDEKSRPMFSLNLRCFVEPAADSSANMHRESL